MREGVVVPGFIHIATSLHATQARAKEIEMNAITKVVACGLIVSTLGACGGMSVRERDTVVGGGVGAAAGAALTGDAADAIGGGIVGGVIGNQIGKNRR